MDIMVRKVLGLTSIVFFIFLQACIQTPVEILDASKHQINTKKGITYCDGKTITGLLYQTTPTGDTIFSTVFLNGKEHGTSKRFFANGQQEELRYFTNGKKEGVHEGWYPNGKIRFRSEFMDDEFHGNVKQWAENGQLIRNLNYENGHEFGTQQVWDINGKIKTNYIIKNGRRYGLLGSKNCVNVGDSVSVGN